MKRTGTAELSDAFVFFGFDPPINGLARSGDLDALRARARASLEATGNFDGEVVDGNWQRFIRWAERWRTTTAPIVALDTLSRLSGEARRGFGPSRDPYRRMHPRVALASLGALHRLCDLAEVTRHAEVPAARPPA